MIVYGVYGTSLFAEDNIETMIKLFVSKDDADKYAELLTKQLYDWEVNDYTGEWPDIGSPATVREVQVYESYEQAVPKPSEPFEEGDDLPF